MNVRPMIVGEAPPPRGCREPLDGDAGRRMARYAGTTLSELLRVTDRTNLLSTWPGGDEQGSEFPPGAARQAAVALAASLTGRRVLLLGRRVAAAFGLRSAPILTFMESDELRCTVAVLPHPSGQNTWWNDLGHRATARSFLAELLRTAGAGFQEEVGT